MTRLALVFLPLAVAAVMPSQAFPAAPEERDFAPIVAPSIDPEASCELCHADVLRLKKLVARDQVHEDIECVECHLGRRFNPHLPPELDESATALAEEIGAHFERSPDVIASCADCHEDETDEWRESIHGGGIRNDDGERRPGCVDCHGPPHTLTFAGQSKREMAARCVVCHEFDPSENGPASPYVVDTYRETVHGKMLALGNDDAAGCADCHTGHDIHARDDPRSSVHADNRAATCRSCHESATDSFTAAISHRPHTIDADFWAWATALAFSVLTVGIIVLLILHVILDLYRAGIAMLRRDGEPQHGPDDAPLAADDEVQRLDVHARLQHGIMIVSFVTLAFTGWPLKSAAVGVSSRLVQLLGGQSTLALAHRVAGAVLLGVSVYHLVYLAVRWRRGDLGTSLIPAWKDVRDLIGNLLYFIGVRRERPKFGKFTYYEKFDYWAVFWGVAIMGGTGLVLWFPELTARLLPGDFILLAFIAHSDEALLAALAIFLWHFYNVHLRPSVFPMSWVWLTGRITGEALYDEHRLEYEESYGSQPPRAAAQGPGWFQNPVWSFAALLTVLLAGSLVLVMDVASVRAELAALQTHPATFEPSEPVTVELAGVYDPGFDPWGTCEDCHNGEHFEAGEEAFPHKQHFEEEELDDDCADCHESLFHEQLQTHREDCLDCHEPDEIGMEEPESD
jgi:cytochrome b subunit of formate dehydrogenase